jgi:hypothetical protein
MPPLAHPDSPVTMSTMPGMVRIHMTAKDRLTFTSTVYAALGVFNRKAAKAHKRGAAEAAMLAAHAAQLDRLCTMLAATPANVDAECTIAPERETETA